MYVKIMYFKNKFLLHQIYISKTFLIFDALNANSREIEIYFRDKNITFTIFKAFEKFEIEQIKKKKQFTNITDLCIFTKPKFVNYYALLSENILEFLKIILIVSSTRLFLKMIRTIKTELCFQSTMFCYYYFLSFGLSH